MTKKSGKSEFSPLNLKLAGKIFSYGYWADGNPKVWRPCSQYMEKASADREDKANKRGSRRWESGEETERGVNWWMDPHFQPSLHPASPLPLLVTWSNKPPFWLKVFQLGFPSLATKECWLLKLSCPISESRDHVDHSLGKDSFFLGTKSQDFITWFPTKRHQVHNYTLAGLCSSLQFTKFF